MAERQLTENFHSTEFECKCGCEEGEMDIFFMTMLQEARSEAHIPFRIRSGIRCQEHNNAVGGSPNSSHLIGRAADIAYIGSRQCFLIMSSLINAGFRRIGIGETFIHVDNDDRKDQDVLWNYYAEN